MKLLNASDRRRPAATWLAHLRLPKSIFGMLRAVILLIIGDKYKKMHLFVQLGRADIGHSHNTNLSNEYHILVTCTRLELLLALQ